MNQAIKDLTALLGTEKVLTDDQVLLEAEIGRAHV